LERQRNYACREGGDKDDLIPSVSRAALCVEEINHACGYISLAVRIRFATSTTISLHALVLQSEFDYRLLRDLIAV
jgi:hypothetical protein